MENNKEANATYLKTAFTIAIVGAVITLFSAGLDLFDAIKDKDNDNLLAIWLGIAGYAVWGVGLARAGAKITSIGHKETGITTAGGALIFGAIMLICIELFSEEKDFVKGAMGYVWTGLMILGPAIFYFSLKQEDDKEDKYFDSAAIGMGIVAITTILLFAAIKIAMAVAEGHGIKYTSNEYFEAVEISPVARVGMWIIENYKLVLIIATSATTLGYFVSLCSMCSYKTVIAELEEDKKDAEREKMRDTIIDEMIEERKVKSQENSSDEE